MEENEVELTPTGLKGSKEGILNLNRRRMRATYFRQDADGRWVGTTPLPADPYSQTYYFAKGFRAKPPVVASAPQETFGCPDCEFVAKSAFGLQAHQRKHNKEVK